MPLRFGLNKSLAFWIIPISAIFLFVFDAVVTKSVHDVKVNYSEIVVGVKGGRSCKLTVTVNGVFESRNVDERVCKFVVPGQVVLLQKTSRLNNWLSITLPNTNQKIMSNAPGNATTWIFFLLILILPILSRFELRKDFYKLYIGGVIFITFYSGYVWVNFL